MLDYRRNRSPRDLLFRPLGRRDRTDTVHWESARDHSLFTIRIFISAPPCLRGSTACLFYSNLLRYLCGLMQKHCSVVPEELISPGCSLLVKSSVLSGSVILR